MNKGKKMLAVVLAMVMSLCMLTGCFNDEVTDELVKFCNEDMTETNTCMTDLTAETAKWTGMTDTKEMKKSLQEKLIPALDKSIASLDKAELKTTEVKELRDICKKAFATYKEGFNDMVTALDKNDTEALKTASTKVSSADALVKEYKAALDKLAKDKDVTLK